MSMFNCLVAEMWSPKSLPDIPPPQYPVSIIDLERTEDCYDMTLPMQDPCPNCKAFRMQVGDWVCWGFCGGCYNEAVKSGEINDSY